VTRRQQVALFAAWALATGTSVGAALYASDTAVDQSRTDLEAVAVASAQQQRENGLAGCERSVADRADSVLGWRAARAARLATARNPQVPIAERLRAAGAAATYRDVIAGFRARMVRCRSAWPPVRANVVRQALHDLTGGR
jgi:hypothetical protein